MKVAAKQKRVALQGLSRTAGTEREKLEAKLAEVRGCSVVRACGMVRGCGVVRVCGVVRGCSVVRGCGVVRGVAW